jgi:hypothetical protein
MMEKMMGQVGKGKLPALPGLGDLTGIPGAGPAGPAPLVRRTPSKNAKKKRKSGRR